MLVALAAQIPPPFAQWMAMPTKSVCAFARAAVPDGAAAEATASFHSGDAAPKTWVMSPKAPVPVFSSSILAVDTPPKLQPARVNGTHGAGVVFGVPESPLTMFGRASRGGPGGVPGGDPGGGGGLSSTRSVEYLNEVLNCGLPVGSKYK